MLYTSLKINFLLIQPLCQISKRLYSESKPCDYQRTALGTQNITYQPSRLVMKVRNINKMNHLPLMIFIWLHSQDSRLHNKCSFCSIKSLFICKNLNFDGAFCSVIQWLKCGHKRQTKIQNSIRKVRRNMASNVYIQPSG